MNETIVFKTIIGYIEVEAEDNKIVRISLLRKDNDKLLEDKELLKINNPLLLTCKKELEEYFLGVRKDFTIPILLKGTEFQKSVWKCLLNIPYGELYSYKDIALQLNDVKKVRAVGQAISKNPLLIVVPCHRVIGSNKKLVGFACGLDIKEILINLERKSK